MFASGASSYRVLVKACKWRDDTLGSAGREAAGGHLGSGWIGWVSTASTASVAGAASVSVGEFFSIVSFGEKRRSCYGIGQPGAAFLRSCLYLHIAWSFRTLFARMLVPYLVLLFIRSLWHFLFIAMLPPPARYSYA